MIKKWLLLCHMRKSVQFSCFKDNYGWIINSRDFYNQLEATILLQLLFIFGQNSDYFPYRWLFSSLRGKWVLCAEKSIWPYITFYFFFSWSTFRPFLFSVWLVWGMWDFQTHRAGVAPLFFFTHYSCLEHSYLRDKYNTDVEGGTPPSSVIVVEVQ